MTYSELIKSFERIRDYMRQFYNRYRLTLRYDREDETELLIRVLSFGPVLKVVSPDSFIDKVKERLRKQFALRA